MIPEQVQELLVRARNAFRLQDYETAEDLVQQMLAKFPDSVTATILMGIIAGRSDRPADAIRLFKRALDLDPKSAEAYNNLAVILRQQGRLKTALTAVRNAEKLDQTRADILYNKGNIFKDLGQTDEAVKAYHQAIKIDEKFVLAYNNLGTLYQADGQVDRALETFAVGLSIDPNHPTLRYNLGLAYEAKGALEEAEKAYQRSLRARPGWGEALNNLGIVYQKQERFDDAEQTFRDVLSVSRANPRANNNLATNFALQGRTREAMQYYREALESDPSYSKAAGNLGQLLDTQSEFAGAVEELQQLAELDTTNLDLQIRLAKSLARTGKYPEAERVLQRILAQDDRHLEATRVLADTCFRSGQDDKADKFYARIATLNADYSEHILDRAYVYRLREQTVAGIEEVDKYLERNPGNLDALLLKGQLLVDQGREGDALQMLEELRNIYPGDGRVLAAIAAAHQHGGEREEAIRAVDELINLQGSRASSEDIAALNESLELYEQAVDAFAEEHQEVWERNLSRLGELSITDEEEEEAELAVEEVEALDEDSIPILSFGGEELLEPDEWDVRVEDDEDLEEELLGYEEPEPLAPSLATLPDEQHLRSVPEMVAGGVAPVVAEAPAAAAPAPPQPSPVQPPAAQAPQPQPEPQYAEAPPQPEPAAPAAPPVTAPEPQPDIQPESVAPDLAPAVSDEGAPEPPPPGYPTYPTYPPYPPYPEPDEEPEEELESKEELQELADELDVDLEPIPDDELLAEDLLLPGEDSDGQALLDDILGEDESEDSDEGDIAEEEVPQIELEPNLDSGPDDEPDENGDSLFEEESLENADDGAVPEPLLPEPIAPEPPPPLVMPEDPEEPQKPPDQSGGAGLLDYLSSLTRSLPPDKQQEYLNSEIRLKLEYLRSRLSGQPGLKRDVEESVPSVSRQPPVPLTPTRLTDTLSYMGRMSSFHPDAAIGTALSTRVKAVMEHIRKLKESSL